jgi:epoxide hydrolase 4
MLRFRHLDLGDVRLHLAEAGPDDGPLVVLLHGFPEFWFEWRDYFAPFAAAGFHVVAPDQRGYNLSDKPQGSGAYRLDRLAADIFALADRLGAKSFDLVGHDWGAAVAWWMASQGPERLKRLAIINAPHPAIWRASMSADAEQKRKSRYVQMLRLPLLPEALIQLGGFRALETACVNASASVRADYHRAWRQPGALTGALNWYRALFLQALPIPAPNSLATPTLILWGDLDAFAEAGLAERSAALCSKVEVIHIPDAGHWVVREQPERIAGHLLRFLSSSGLDPNQASPAKS